MKYPLKNEVSIHINANKEKVWDALTKPEIIKKYFFGTNTESTWQPGTLVRFYGEWEGKKYEDKGTVLENKNQELLKYNYWSSMSGIEDKAENYADITFTLEPDENGTTLTILQENIPDEKMRAHSAENWNMVLDNMKKLLEDKN
ncbi:MAG: SRPBCC domain-containing protein [Bacteroidota bacterium]